LDFEEIAKEVTGITIRDNLVIGIQMAQRINVSMLSNINAKRVKSVKLLQIC
jgi:hypothetical protein